jgi:hypothetical protein
MEEFYETHLGKAVMFIVFQASRYGSISPLSAVGALGLEMGRE